VYDSKLYTQYTVCMFRCVTKDRAVTDVCEPVHYTVELFTNLSVFENLILYFKLCIFKTQYFTPLPGFTNCCNISTYPCCVTQLPEDGNMIGRNMLEIYYVHNILSYTDVHLLSLPTTSNSGQNHIQQSPNLMASQFVIMHAN
jgi:hypothetical protein